MIYLNLLFMCPASPLSSSFQTSFLGFCFWKVGEEGDGGGWGVRMDAYFHGIPQIIYLMYVPKIQQIG